MIERLVVHSAAEADIVQAALWYEQRGPGLGSEFLRAVDVVLAEIARTPERFPVVHHTCRRALLRRFPYAQMLDVSLTPDGRSRLSTVASRPAHG